MSDQIQCIDSNNNCGFSEPVNYFDALKNIYQLKDKTQQDKQLKENLCGKNTGTVSKCCDPNDTSIINLPGIIKIKKINDANNNLNQIQACVCDSPDPQCPAKNCPGFVNPSKYLNCKIWGSPEKVKKVQTEQGNNDVWTFNQQDMLQDCKNQCSNNPITSTADIQNLLYDETGEENFNEQEYYIEQGKSFLSNYGFIICCVLILLIIIIIFGIYIYKKK